MKQAGFQCQTDQGKKELDDYVSKNVEQTDSIPGLSSLRPQLLSSLHGEAAGLLPENPRFLFSKYEREDKLMDTKNYAF